jgi:AhpD family alkylhydroperoxidase
MAKDYINITTSISSSLTDFKNNSADLMQAFQSISHAATKSGVLDEKTKELIALAIGVAKQCDGCIGFHVKKLVKLGVKKEELIEMLNVAVYMGGGPALMYAADTILAFEQFSKNN